MPIALASSSVCCSSAQQAWGAVGARTEPEGWWFVYTQCASTCTLWVLYGPAMCIAASSEKKAESAV